MATCFESEKRSWREVYPGVFAFDLHRYPTGRGAALFRLSAGATIPEHDHPTGEHGYVISGSGLFGGRSLSAGDAFWMNPGESHDVRATSDLAFFATSLPRC